MLLHELEGKLRSGKAYDCLKIMCEDTLKAINSGNDEKITFSRFVLKARFDEKCPDEQSDLKEIQKWINDKRLNTFLALITEAKNDSFSELGYVPVVKNNGSNGGKGNEKLYWLDIEKLPESVDNLPDKNDDVDIGRITYIRADPSAINASLFFRLIFKQGELKNRSLRGVVLAIVIFGSFIFGVLYILCVALVLVRKGQTYTSFDLLIILAIGLCAWNFVTRWFMPIVNLPEQRVIKAPLGFLALSELDAEIEMYRDNHKNQITIFTRFTSVCPICAADIVLRDGKPDQKAPLVGRCVESPYDHVYSFDRVTLKGKYLGF